MNKITLFRFIFVLAFIFTTLFFGCGGDKVADVEVTTYTVTDFDGNVYQAVTIGNQVWMAENLKVTHYRNGDPIPNIIDSYEWRDLTTGAYCNYYGDSHLPTYGFLYNWYSVNDSRGLAPDGWHIPTDEEWKQLEMYLGMSQEEADQTGFRVDGEGGMLKDTGTTHWDGPNTGATNESGFTALPGGQRFYYLGTFNYMGAFAYFWVAAVDDSNYGRSLYAGESAIGRESYDKRNGLSVRCVKD